MRIGDKILCLKSITIYSFGNVFFFNKNTTYIISDLYSYSSDKNYFQIKIKDKLNNICHVNVNLKTFKQHFITVKQQRKLKIKQIEKIKSGR